MLIAIGGSFNGYGAHTIIIKTVQGIHADEPFSVYADGDYIGAPPAHIEVCTQSLRVLVAK